jgi:SAM-dependent methyltransferase
MTQDGASSAVDPSPSKTGPQPEDDFELVIPESVYREAVGDVGVFFEKLNGIDRHTLATDHLDCKKSYGRALLLQSYAELRGKRLLEIGSGYGTNLASWMKAFDVDGYGVEPASLGFDKSFLASKSLFQANGLDPNRIIDAQGESLPFPDAEFDIVYSSNVLEHTADPLKVLMESVRVLRPGGLIHMEIPNYLSYFEGHYMLPMPPVWSTRFLGAWLRIFGRDPAFASTLRLINPIWCARAVRQINQIYPVQAVSFGREVFLRRLTTRFDFEMRSTAGKIGWAIQAVQLLNVGNWIGRLIVLCQGYYPIYLTVRKL